MGMTHWANKPSRTPLCSSTSTCAPPSAPNAWRKSSACPQRPLTGCWERLRPSSISPLWVQCLDLWSAFLTRNKEGDIPVFPGPSRWNGWRSGCSVPGRASHSDDTEHFPLRRCVGQKRNAGRASSEGADQHLQEAQNPLPHCLPAGSGSTWCRESQGHPLSTGTHNFTKGKRTNINIIF